MGIRLSLLTFYILSFYHSGYLQQNDVLEFLYNLMANQGVHGMGCLTIGFKL